ncbi:MAG TPA: ATP-binding protein [Stellaceae bacterium]|nr:ATP-binding protein [Stellaceae bacterium]
MPSYGNIDDALHAAERGASLTRQLLSFARKQELAMELVDVNRLLASICEMLPRTLGPTVRIETSFAADAGQMLTDPNHLELAILNLAINARDAMPDGGTLTVASANAPADAAAASEQSWNVNGYLMLAVSDTGGGMSEEVRNRAFEPFYTTKGVGKGSGLGLSMVYGFVQQCSGKIEIDSAIGRGTTVRLFLPRAEPAAVVLADATSGPVDAGPPARLLVVDDDDAVRASTSALLRDLGHEVVETSGGAEGLALLKANDAFDAVITDIGMQQMSGCQFAKEIRQIAPDLPVLFVTGYADDRGGVAPDEILLRKPFHRRDLAVALRSVLQPR